MATAHGGKYFDVPGFVATGDLSSYQYYIVKHASTAGACKLATTAATDTIIGILMNDPTDGQPAEIACVGVCMALAEASVAVGNPLTCSSTGRVKATTTDKDEIVGFAVKASAAAGDLIPIILSRFTLSA